MALLTGGASTGSAERNWKSHSVILSKFRQRLSTGKLHQLVYTYHNKRLLRLPRSHLKVVEQQLCKDEIIDADDIKEHIVDDLDIENEALDELLGDVVPLFDEE